MALFVSVREQNPDFNDAMIWKTLRATLSQQLCFQMVTTGRKYFVQQVASMTQMKSKIFAEFTEDVIQLDSQDNE